MIISTNNLKLHTINIMEFFILRSILLAHLKERELPYNHIIIRITVYKINSNFKKPVRIG